MTREDCISRAELLKAIDTWDKFGCDGDSKLVPYNDNYVPYIHYDDVIKCIKGMPSVTLEGPKTGRWIFEIWNNREHYFCSECYRIVNYEPFYHYCPFCGAKMESSDVVVMPDLIKKAVDYFIDEFIKKESEEE